MNKLTVAETDGLYRAVEAENAAKRAAGDALQEFGAIDVFTHLRASAGRHITRLCDVLHTGGANAPVLAPVEPTRSGSLVKALEAAADRETQTATIYHEILQHTNNSELKRVLLPLWQSVSHLHLTAIADQLALEEQSSE